MTWAVTLLLIVSLASYSWAIIRRWAAWAKISEPTIPIGWTPTIKLSIIIPVRNEAANILNLLQDLEKQQYPKALFEIIVIDDHSEDETKTIVEQYARASALQIKIIELNTYVNYSGKKAAIKTGIELAEGELLVFTDGDCRVQPEWLQLYSYSYQTYQPKFISGPVSFQNTQSLLERMQLVEFASLIGIGGASIGLGKPNMCNGANLAYTKQVFEEVNGFEGNETIASGDDEFLLHKISHKYPGKAFFLKHKGAIVYTEARKTIDSFLSQRIRWASKWRAYQDADVKLLALIVFIVNLVLFVALLMAIVGIFPVSVFITGLVVKFAADFLFLSRILRFLGRKQYIWYMFPLQLVYIPYVLVTAILGLTGRYRWKGRTIQNR
ncbi:glycosyltransferase [Pontibacter sp. BT310]|uniref:Glycosyltransferase n=1 Tax=Pontibacter populi TaxID=890055 RepID=A0ABS6XBG1_9BACT|nr:MULTISPECIES: glycosyltransferase [Pontibacter]MBJ6118481.1 glycosyltransferase [Pontibacter sp. BT310]MBW3365335.1 glycosyltransferase [Pontibacter populi]